MYTPSFVILSPPLLLQVEHLEPWEKNSRKLSGQVGMCAGVRKWPKFELFIFRLSRFVALLLVALSLLHFVSYINYLLSN